MDKETVSALLGRSLTSFEDTNFDLYLAIAEESLDEILCTNLSDDSDTRYFTGWEGYSTVWTDIFTEIESVEIDGSIVDSSSYIVKQNDARIGTWYNSIVFDERLSENKEIKMVGTWGFSVQPDDLNLVLANLFALVSKKNKFDGTLKSKRVEDFGISIDTEADLDAIFNRTFGRTIAKYSNCGKMGMINGDLRC